MLLNGINHIAVISNDIDRVGDFYTKVLTPRSDPRRPTVTRVTRP